MLINQSHTYTDLHLPIDEEEKQPFEAIDGKRTIAEIVRSTWGRGQHWEHTHSFFERLWWYDQGVFDASNPLGQDHGSNL